MNTAKSELYSSQIEPEINLYASSDSSTSFDGNMLQSLDVLPTMRIIDDSHGDDDDISFTQSNEAETGLESDPPTSLSHASNQGQFSYFCVFSLNWNTFRYF